VLLAQVIYLFLPLLVSAALSAVILRYDLLPALRRPIDAGASWRGRRLFGDSKTWRGVIVAVVGSTVTVVGQRLLAHRAPALAIVDYRDLDPVAFGAAMGLGAMLGEPPNSFVKRRLGIAPGKTTKGPLSAVFYVWDQIDLLTGAWPLLLCWVRPSAVFVIASFAVAMVLHPTVALVGYFVGARSSAR
jgi:CDP-2,3-bis-(O-geranylgeranyl)-sn-glycerol synthase